MTHSTLSSLTVRRADTRGRAQFGWLDSRHSFSFGSYQDPQWMGYGALRVINDDRVSAGGGFPSHPHENMEIISYVVEGELEHKDSMGNGSVIRAGDVQYMSAGSGVVHSEFNPLPSAASRFLQIWVLPEKNGLPPRYAQVSLDRQAQREGWVRVLHPQGDSQGGLIEIRQQLELYSRVIGGDEVELKSDWVGKRLWMQVVRGTLRVGDEELHEGDALLGRLEAADLVLLAEGEAEVLLFVQD